MHYSKLRNDLVYLNKSFALNPLLSERQKKTYASSLDSGGISPAQWAKSNTANLPELVLSEEDGYDDEPICSISPERSRNFFRTGEAGFLPQLRDIIRAGFFFHVEIFRVLALCIKREWEVYAFMEKQSPGTRKPKSSKRAQLHNLETCFDHEFSPDFERIFETLLGERNILEANTLHSPTLQAQKELDRITSLFYTDYDEKAFNVLGREILLNSIHLAPIDSDKMSFFSNLKSEETSMLKHTSDHDKQLFLMFKSTWIDLEIELLEVSREGEETFVLFYKALEDFLSIFEKQYLELTETEKNLRMINLKIAARKEENTAQAEKIDIAERETRETAAVMEGLETLVMGIINAFKKTDSRSGKRHRQSAAPNRMKAAYSACAYYLDPGRLEINPKYKEMKAEQRERLRSLWDKANEIAKDSDEAAESGKKAKSMGRILEDAKCLLSSSCPDNEIRYLIHGNSIKAQVRWLQTQIDTLEREITTIKDEITALRIDTEEKRAVVKDKQGFENYRLKMKEKNETKKKEYEKLQEQYTKLAPGEKK